MAGLAQAPRVAADAVTFDLSRQTLRELNLFLHRNLGRTKQVKVLNPDGAHSIAAGVNAAVDIEVDGHAGYYLGGMNQHARILVRGNAGPGVAEGMTSGLVHVKGFASVSAGAAGHGGLLVVEGDTSLRCGISMKGIDIVVGGSVGDFSAFMAQAGRLVICGDAGDALGDSLYEAVIYVRGKVKSLGADAGEQPMGDADYAAVGELLARAGIDHDPKQFRRIASKRELYHWNADSNQEY
jgi:glutamate synthase domain-containing protein 3